MEQFERLNLHVGCDDYFYIGKKMVVLRSTKTFLTLTKSRKRTESRYLHSSPAWDADLRKNIN